MDTAVPVDHRVKVKESQKVDKFLNLARKPKKKSVDDITKKYLWTILQKKSVDDITKKICGRYY